VRIALVSTPFVAVPPAGYGGTELVVHALSGALTRAGHDVTVFATGDSEAPDLRALFETPVWPPHPYLELLHCRFAAREIRRERFDVVHAHSPALLGFVEELGAPLVYTLHHERDRVLSEYYERSPGVFHVAISARQAELASPSPIAVVHHGLDPALYPGLGPGGDEALYIGRLAWAKGPELAIEAARLAGMRITMVGSSHPGDHAPPRWSEDVLAPALASPHVTHVASADLAAKRLLLARSRALVLPLRWEEPFGLVIIEALLAGCPVVAFPRGAAPELVDEGSGFLVKDEAELAEALARASELDRAAIQARARERFSADRMAEGYLAVYRAVAARRRPVSAARQEAPWTTLSD
jgi:glycosyltransferase involved in cell wall biosynthesis